MELKLKPARHNLFPLGGFLIRSTSPKAWLLELQTLQFELDEVELYPIPGNKANTIWGCFVLINKAIDPQNLGRNERCQRVYPNLFIPEKAKLLPTVLPKDYELLFSENKHLFHPDFGLVELDESFDMLSLIGQPQEQFVYVFKPSPSVFIPKRVNSFEIKEVEGEDALKAWEEKTFPEKKSLKDKDKPLSRLEKGKLSFYKKFFNKEKAKDGSLGETEKTGFMSRLQGLFGRREGGMFDRMEQNFDDLEERNQKEVDKLMDLLKNNPEEALKYAIPLDDNSSTRGPELGQFNMSRRWGNFSLFGNLSSSATGGSGASGSVDLGGDNYQRLNQQYHKTAQDLIDKKEYEKAAFVYMKLLKNYQLGASTLVSGGFYQEAALIYLKYCKDKLKAAEAYEQGKLTHEAIDLYIELDYTEKVGDLYLSLNKRKKANIYYEKTVATHIERQDFMSGAELYRNKMQEDTKAQELLLRGWEGGRQRRQCLITYIDFIQELKTVKSEMDRIYADKVNPGNRQEFLKVVHHEYKKDSELNKHLREIAYQIISAEAEQNPAYVDELKKFNKNDPQIVKDTGRYRFRKPRR